MEQAELTTQKQRKVPGVPFKKGDPRINREGRPKGTFSLVEMIKNKLQEVPEGKDKTYAQYFIEQLMKKAVIEGDTQMMRDMINRVDGMPKQGIDHTTNGKDFIPIYAGKSIQGHDSNEESVQNNKEN